MSELVSGANYLVVASFKDPHLAQKAIAWANKQDKEFDYYSP